MGGVLDSGSHSDQRRRCSAASALASHDDDHLTGALDSGTGRLAHPTPDHYLPLLYAAGASGSEDPVRFPITGFDMSSLSMRSAILG